jgi:hypothetical protein
MRRIVVLAAVAAVLAGAGNAAAQQAQEDRGVRLYGLGPRIGLSINPDQFVFGGHLDFGDPIPHFTWLIPVVEIGVGDDRTVTSIGSDLYYRFYDRWGAWTPYVGGELALLINSVDNGDDDTQLGFMGLLGVEKGIGDNRFALEVKIKLVDTPDFKFMGTWTFGH